MANAVPAASVKLLELANAGEFAKARVPYREQAGSDEQPARSRQERQL
jgi:hypothetical protein